MRLRDFHSALGMGAAVGDKRKLNKILRMASSSPDKLHELPEDKSGKVHFARYKYLGNGFGVFIHGFRKWGKDKEGKKIEKHNITDWGVFAEGVQDIIIHEVAMDMDGEQNTYCVCEEDSSEHTFEFVVHNSFEMMEKFRSMPTEAHAERFEQTIGAANVAMLMVYGTVILPVMHSEEGDSFREQEENLQRELWELAKKGDPEAAMTLAQMDQENDELLRERLETEDFLTVFEHYFYNLAEQSGIFSILGDIRTVEELTNEATEEKIYRLGAVVTGMPITLYMAHSSTVGLPMEGMRIMGLGLMQGAVRVN